MHRNRGFWIWINYILNIMERINQQTRAIYDKNIANARNAIIQKPMKYVTNLLSDSRALSEPHPNNIDKSTDLRMKPTRLNYYNRPEGELYGTAPFEGRDARSFVDVESFLRNSESFMGCNRNLTERTWETQDFLNTPLSVDTGLRPTSTRANLRNEYCNVANRSYNPNTHHKK